VKNPVDYSNGNGIPACRQAGFVVITPQDDERESRTAEIK